MEPKCLQTKDTNSEAIINSEYATIGGKVQKEVSLESQLTTPANDGEYATVLPTAKQPPNKWVRPLPDVPELDEAEEIEDNDSGSSQRGEEGGEISPLQNPLSSGGEGDTLATQQEEGEETPSSTPSERRAKEEEVKGVPLETPEDPVVLHKEMDTPSGAVGEDKRHLSQGEEGLYERVKTLENSQQYTTNTDTPAKEHAAHMSEDTLYYDNPDNVETVENLMRPASILPDPSIVPYPSPLHDLLWKLNSEHHHTAAFSPRRKSNPIKMRDGLRRLKHNNELLFRDRVLHQSPVLPRRPLEGSDFEEDEYTIMSPAYSTPTGVRSPAFNTPPRVMSPVVGTPQRVDTPTRAMSPTVNMFTGEEEYEEICINRNN